MLFYLLIIIYFLFYFPYLSSLSLQYFELWDSIF